MGPQIAAAVHFAAAIEDCPMLEYNPNVFEIANRHLSIPLTLEEGHYIVPDRPGLGVTLTNA
jgi:galactonate dehydratase